MEFAGGVCKDIYKTHISQKIAYICVLVKRGYLSSGSTNSFIS